LFVGVKTTDVADNRPVDAFNHDTVFRAGFVVVGVLSRTSSGGRIDPIVGVPPSTVPVGFLNGGSRHAQFEAVQPQIGIHVQCRHGDEVQDFFHGRIPLRVAFRAAAGVGVGKDRPRGPIRVARTAVGRNVAGSGNGLESSRHLDLTAVRQKGVDVVRILERGPPLVLVGRNEQYVTVADHLFDDRRIVRESIGVVVQQLIEDVRHVIDFFDIVGPGTGCHAHHHPKDRGKAVAQFRVGFRWNGPAGSPTIQDVTVFQGLFGLGRSYLGNTDHRSETEDEEKEVSKEQHNKCTILVLTIVVVIVVVVVVVVASHYL